jgi:Icc-related predicted phosphoesterase
MIIHAGDISKRGAKHEVIDFLNWFSSLDFEYKIFIAGNHDFFLEQAIDYELQEIIPDNVIYLNDSGITINNINIWGSPVQPWFHDWAFNRQRGEDIKKHWDLIPDSTDILITHGPPYEILDTTIHNQHVGCQDLLNKVLLVKPKIHVFGHIHESYGQKIVHDIQFINASVLDEKYRLVNKLVEVDY